MINFFTSSDHALTYQSAHALDGVVLELSDAVEAGALVFGDLLRSQSARPAARG